MASKQPKPSLKTSIYAALAYRLALAMLMFSLCRLVYYLYNHSYFPDISTSQLSTIFLGGLRFDLTALLFLNSPFILLQILPLTIRHHSSYQKLSFWLYILSNSAGIVMNLADTVYYQITLKRTTAAVFQQFAGEANLPGLVFRFLLEFWYVELLAAVLIALLIFLYKRVSIRSAPTQNIWLYSGTQLAMMAAAVGLAIGGIRGGFKHSTRPITLSNASVYTNKPSQRAIVLNTPFALFRTLKKKTLHEQHYFSSQAEQEAVFTACKSGKPDSAMLKRNVVVFILESFGTEHIAALNRNSPNHQGFTPFLDSLIDESYTFQYSYANGRKSISAMPSVLAGVPSLVEPFILSHYSGSQINSIASALGDEGYYTAFFHGAANGSMGFDAFAKQAGFQDYFGKDEFNNDAHYDGIWGIWDEEFFQYFNQEMTKMKEPFFTCLFSTSSHHPFILPEKYKDKFPKGSSKIHKNIGYTDYALRLFFAEAAQSDWFRNTIFILTADHSSTYSDLAKYKTSVGVFAVPLIVYEPAKKSRRGVNNDIAVQQNDIMPTVLSLLNYPKAYIAFGNDVFDEDADHFAINYIGDAYQLIMDGYVLHFDGKQTIALYDYKHDDMLKHNIMTEKPAIMDKLETKVKAIIQEYNRRLINDELVVR